jgi:DNA-directed RNA polymerase sigma subunit (sigma70/sigma32)
LPCLYEDGDGEMSESFEQLYARDTLEFLFCKLPERKAKIVRDKFGFDDGVEKTLEETGNLNGIQKERVRQIILWCLKVMNFHKNKFGL